MDIFQYVWIIILAMAFVILFVYGVSLLFKVYGWKIAAIFTSSVIIFVIFMWSLIVFANNAEAATLSEKRQDVADQIADICIEEWDSYGRLPSVAVAQAFVESGLGSGPNLFGVIGQSGKGTVASTYGYLNCLNNEYFKGEGAFIFDREEQLRIIMKGGRYCEGQYPGGSYYNNVLSSIDKYGWSKYDTILAKKLARAERERNKRATQRAAKKVRQIRQRLPFRLIFDDEALPGTCITDPAYIKKGSVIIYAYNIVEVTETRKGLENTIIVSKQAPDILDDLWNPASDSVWSFIDSCTDHTVKLTEVIENAKG